MPILGAATPYLRGRGNGVDTIPVPIVLHFQSASAALSYLTTFPWTLSRQGPLAFVDEGSTETTTITFSNAVLSGVDRERKGSSVFLEYHFVVNGPPTVSTVNTGTGGDGPNPLSPSDTRPATLLTLSGYDMPPITQAVSLTDAVRSASQGNNYYSQYFVFQLDGLAQKGQYIFETSSAFDSYIFLHSTANSLSYNAGNRVAEDDESGPGSGSRIVFNYDGLAPFVGSLEVSHYDQNTAATGQLTVTCGEFVPSPVVVGNEMTWNLTGLNYPAGNFQLWAEAYNNFPDGNISQKFLQSLTFAGTYTGSGGPADLAILLTASGNLPQPTAQNLLSTAGNTQWNGFAIIGNVSNINAPSWVAKYPWPFTNENFVPNQLYTINLAPSSFNGYQIGFYRGNAGSTSGAWNGTLKIINTP